jgi:beta-glucosidase
VTADLLLGKRNPIGKLPITFPAKFQDSPVFAPGHPERYFGDAPDAGSKNRVIYSEGIFVGYRYFDENKIEPLFPFGFGLSYTTFDYSDLRTVPTGDGIDVSFRVKNTGQVDGSEIAQVYVGRPQSPPIPMAPRILAGFSRIDLRIGESKVIRVHVARRQLSNWIDEKKSWVLASGEREVFVGGSSRDLPLKSIVAISESK